MALDCSPAFCLKLLSIWYLLKTHAMPLVTLRAGHVLHQSLNLNKFKNGPLVDATYQKSRPLVRLYVKKIFFLMFSLSKSINAVKHENHNFNKLILKSTTL